MLLILFDPRPKSQRSAFFDRDEEIKELKESVARSPLTFLLGIRRIGKTSVLKVALNELEAPYVYLDLRILEEEGYSKVALYLLNILASFKDSSHRLNSILKPYASIPLILFKCSISLFHLNAVLEKASDKSLSNNFSGKEHSNCSRFF